MPKAQTRLTSDNFKSNLERVVSEDVERRLGAPVPYEKFFIEYTIPSRVAKYTPDFILPNNIIPEVKGYFDADDRHKHLLIKSEYPDLPIRFVFQSSRTKIYKGSPTSYADWCNKHGFEYADKKIPDEWLKEPHQDLHPAMQPKKSKVTNK